MALLKKYLLIAAGSLALAFGVIGLFLPVLPTVPFLLLASFCYLRSSQRLYQWLMGHKILGAHLYNYTVHRGVLRSTKISALVFLWVTLSVSIILVNQLWVRLLLFLIGGAVSIHLLSLKTVAKAEFWRRYCGEMAKGEETS